MHGGEVTGAGQLDSAVTNVVQQPGVRVHHPRGGVGVDQHRLVQAGIVDQLPQFAFARAGPDGTDQLIQGLGDVAFLPVAAAGRITLVQRQETSQRLIDLVDAEGGRAQAFRAGWLPIEALELGHRVSVIGVARVGGRRDQLVGVDAAAVLGRAVTAASHAYRSWPCIRPGLQGFELDDVLPAVTKVIVVEEPVTSIDQHLVQAHVFLGDPRRPVFDLEGAQVVLGFRSVMPRAGAELVKVGVGPAERYLDDLVDLVEEQVGG